MHKIYRILLLTVALLSFNIYADNGDELLQNLLKTKPSGYVNDYAKVIPVARRQQIEAVSQELRQKTGAVIVLVTLPSLQGASLEDFSVKLAQGWGIGESDQGVLILFALKDKKVRIEVGYGLEHILNDAKVGRIIRENMVPYFKKQSYASGLLNGSAAVATTIAQSKGVQLTGNQQLYNRNRPVAERSTASKIFGFLLLIFCIFMFIKHPQLMILLLLSGRGGGGSRGGFGGGFGGGGFGGGGASGSW